MHTSARAAYGRDDDDDARELWWRQSWKFEGKRNATYCQSADSSRTGLLRRCVVARSPKKLFLAVVHGHFQVDSYAEFAVWQSLDANHFCHVVTIHWIVTGSVGKGNEHAHSFVIASAAGMKINTFFRGVYAGDEVFKVIVAGFRGTHPNRTRHFDAPAAPFLRILCLACY